MSASAATPRARRCCVAEHLLLQLGSAPRQRKPLLLIAQVDVRVGDFGSDRHLRVGEIGVDRFRLRRCRFDRAARAEQVDFPGCVEACRIELQAEPPSDGEVPPDGFEPFDGSSEPSALTSGSRVRMAATVADDFGNWAARCCASCARDARKPAACRSGLYASAAVIRSSSWRSLSACHHALGAGAGSTPVAGARTKVGASGAAGAPR